MATRRKESTKNEAASAPQDATAGASAPQDATADASAPQDATADANAPQDATADASAPQDATADASAPPDATAGTSAPQGARPNRDDAFDIIDAHSLVRGNALVVADAAGAPQTITRKQADTMLRGRAVERYQEAVSEQRAAQQNFDARFGPSDEIDDRLLGEIKALQIRFAAIGARQLRGNYGEPKVSKYASQLGTMIVDISTHLATQSAMKLFTPIQKHEYLGYGDRLGEKGRDETVLDGFVVVEESRKSRKEGEAPCDHAHTIEDEDDQVERCPDCGATLSDEENG